MVEAGTIPVIPGMIAKKGFVRQKWEDLFGSGDGELKNRIERVPALSIVLAVASIIYLIEFVGHQDIFIIFPGSFGLQAQAFLNIVVFIIQAVIGGICLLRSLARIEPHFRSGGLGGVLMGIEMLLFVLVFGVVETATVSGVLYAQGTNPQALFTGDALVDVHSQAYLIQCIGRGVMLFWAEVQVFLTHGDLPFDTPAAKQKIRGILGKWMLYDLSTLDRKGVKRSKIWNLFIKLGRNTNDTDLEKSLNELDADDLAAQETAIRQKLRAEWEVELQGLRDELGDAIQKHNDMHNALSMAIAAHNNGEDFGEEVLSILPAMRYLARPKARAPREIGAARKPTVVETTPDESLPKEAVADRGKLYITAAAAARLLEKKWDTVRNWVIQTAGYDAAKQRAPYIAFLEYVKTKVASAKPDKPLIVPFDIEEEIRKANAYTSPKKRGEVEVGVEAEPID